MLRPGKNPRQRRMPTDACFRFFSFPSFFFSLLLLIFFWDLIYCIVVLHGMIDLAIL